MTHQFVRFRVKFIVYLPWLLLICTCGAEVPAPNKKSLGKSDRLTFDSAREMEGTKSAELSLSLSLAVTATTWLNWIKLICKYNPKYGRR